jgi:hypothetical protein
MIHWPDSNAGGRYEGLSGQEVPELEMGRYLLEEENSRIRRLVSDITLDNAFLKEAARDNS